MPGQKLENLLNLALEASQTEREQSRELNVGYREEERSWEVIVKYHGDIRPLADQAVGVELLIAGYAILTVPESFLPALSEIEEIEYIEKPKRLFFQTLAGKQDSCILPVTVREPFLRGQNVLVGVVDSGIDYRHEAFRKADGSTRILALWDQTLVPDAARGLYSPEGFSQGVLFDRTQIDAALAAESRSGADSVAESETGSGAGGTAGNGTENGAGGSEGVNSRDVSGHGTAVTGIAAGRDGVAPESDIVVVKLGSPAPDSFPKTTELMRAMTWLVNLAVRLEMPIAINVSFGNTYGAHDGTSLLERFMDNVSEIGRCVVCVGSGNEGAAMGHAAGNALERTEVELAVGRYERSFSVQLWLNAVDSYRLSVVSPGGAQETVETVAGGRQADGLARRLLLEETMVLLYIGEPTPYSVRQEIYMDFLPTGAYVNAGIWTFVLEPVRVVTGNYSFYLPSQAVIGTDTHFYRPTPEVTLTIPSTASKVITVGAYDVTYDAYADFSGRGYLYAQDDVTRTGIFQVKPDIVAPGVDIVTSVSGGGYAAFTGTSFATPFVTGAAALLMEWGIVRGNDPYLYGEKVKAYLRRGARPLRGRGAVPEDRTGYGALCLADSLPE